MNRSEPEAGAPHIFVAGAAHIDRRAKADAPYRPAASNPGRLVDAPGGAAFNAAIALKATGAHVTFHGARGGDADGKRVEKAIASAGLDDASVTWLDRPTPSYTAILDDHGELIAGIADMALYDLVGPRLFSRRHVRASIAAADAFLLDANLSRLAIEKLMEKAGDRPVLAIGVSPAKVRRLLGILPSLTAIVLSRAEAASLAEATPSTNLVLLAELVAELGARCAVVTDGPHEAAIVEGERIVLQRPPIVRPRDVTGAGDTLSAVALAGLCGGLGWIAAVRRGLVAASLRISLEHFPPADLVAQIDRGIEALAEPVEPERSI
ncbi:PfkB family carbohydrate kinase [Aurantimonas sp. VKM B-3413]|uniref:PfkB family carbohydrate kinase n=1 Tax=Aurantimonas sp. VKM B-3413 TaxID=2779401 RepID=UPI001E525987|nr:PfkB family carbohydrate kinase [Aurantimonas sp. VKM B-3413]MCB8838144.1 PfkB family carbohydrate kinase [Aurantimonas sp. VKM B-3413]